MRRFASCVIAFALVASTARAQDAPADEPAIEGPSPENLEATRQAREHFMAGVEHFTAHRYREAIQAFSLAAQLVPSADLWFNIARAHEELSELEEAVDYYRRYLRDRVDPPDRAEIERHIAVLEERAQAARDARRNQPTTGTLRLSANRDGADVELDGEPAGTAPWDEPREVAPGRHDLTVTREGFIPFRSEVTVEAGVPTAAYADLVPETRYRAIQADRIFTWIAWGLGAASLGVSIGLGVEAASRQANLGDARTWAAYSDAALGAAIGLGVVGLILYFAEGRSVGTERVTVTDDAATTRVRGPEPAP